MTDVPYIEVEDYDEENYGFNVKQKGISAVNISRGLSLEEVKEKLKKERISSNLNITRDNLPIVGFKDIEETPDGLKAHFIKISSLESKTILGEDLRKQKAYFPPPNNIPIRVKMYDEATVIYFYTGSDKTAKSIISFLESEMFDTVRRVNPGNDLMSELVEENKDIIYELDVDPEIVESAEIDGDDTLVQIEDNTIKGSKGILVLDEEPLIENLSINSSNPPLIEGMRMKEWIDGAEDTSVVLTKVGQLKIYFPVSQFDSSTYTDSDLFGILIENFENKVLYNLI